MNLTHVTKGLLAQDIIEEGNIELGAGTDPRAYCFYGRPAYRIHGDGTIKVEAACPFCFLFKPDLIKEADRIFPFDTGAFEKRMYKHILMKEMNLGDFSLERKVERPNKLISKIFETKTAYFDGDTSKIDSKQAERWEFLAQAYLQLIASPGRNEPDDRVWSIEISFKNPIQLDGNLIAVVVPHTLWQPPEPAPWLAKLSSNGIDILPYNFVPGRGPDYYYANIEGVIRDAYRTWGAL